MFKDLSVETKYKIILKYRQKIIQAFCRGYERNDKVSQQYYEVYKGYNPRDLRTLPIETKFTQKVERLIEIFEFLSRLDTMVDVGKYTDYRWGQNIDELCQDLKEQVKESWGLYKDLILGNF